jgi:multicomponent Na+:H+ antiporter subunit D
MIFGIAIGTVIGIAAAIYYIIHHIIVQTTLFLATGLVERIGGTTSLTRLGGLLKLSPIVGVLFFIPALNLGGIPPFSGFIGKLGLFIAGAELGTPLSYILIAAGAVTSLLTLYALMRAWNLAFWRPKAEADGTAASEPGDEAAASAGAHLTEAPGATQTMTARSAPRLMTRATAAMVLLSLALTVFAGPLYEIAHRAAQDLDGPGAYVHAVLGSDDAP